MTGNGGSLPAEWTVDADGGLTITPTIATSKALKLIPASGATAAFDNVFEIYDDAGHTVLEIDAGGDFLMRPALDASALFEMRFDDVQVNSAARDQLVAFNATFGHDFYIPPTAGFVVWNRGAGAIFVIGAEPDVVVFKRLNAAPTDDFLGPGCFALWLDDTDGAAKLMIKAQSANGSTVTGQVALA